MRLLSGAIPYIPVIQQGNVNFAMSYNIIIYIIIYNKNISNGRITT